MDAKPAPRVWYAGLNERLMELGKEDPEVYKHWHDWYEPRAKQPPWLKPNSPESLEKLMEALDTAIEERRWTHEPIIEGPNKHLGHMRCTKRRRSALWQRGIRRRCIVGCIPFCTKGMSWGRDLPLAAIIEVLDKAASEISSPSGRRSNFSDTPSSLSASRSQPC